MGKSVQAIATEIEWRRMRDHETYYPLRDGPRLQRGASALETMSKYIPADQLALGRRCAALHARIEAGWGRGGGEIAERIHGGDSNASRDVRMRLFGKIIRELAAYEAAALHVGRDGHGVYRGICRGWTQAATMQRIGYPPGSKMTFRRLFQRTLLEIQNAHDRLDNETSGALISM